jgi:hypothetical protein
MRQPSAYRDPVRGGAWLLIVLSVLACVAAPLTAAASAAGTDLLLVRSADLLTRGVLTLSVGAQFYESRDLGTVTGSESYGQYTSLCLKASYGATTWLELSADLPARRAAWDDASGGSNDAATLDAPVIGAKLRIPLSRPALSMAVGLRAGLPTGKELVASGGDSGDVYLTGGSEIDWEAALLATVDLSRWIPARLHVNVGWAGNGDGRGKRFFPDYYPAVPDGGSDADNDALLLRGAIEFPGRNVDLFTEFRGDLISDRDLVSLKENMLYVTPGVRVRFGEGWSATGAVSMGISGDDRDTPGFDPHDAYPDWAATLMVGYAWPVFAADSDRDGIPDFRDDCPRFAEDVDGFRDEDGCPDPDNDSDGILDGMDGRPLLMEDYDGFEDEDGVPDLDNDSDGIVDERDMCPDEPEDLDGFEDEDGCPDE